MFFRKGVFFKISSFHSLFTFGCAGAWLLLHGLFLVVARGGYSNCGAGLLIAVASLVADQGLQGAWASAVVAHGLSCSTPCGIFQDQGSNLSPLHWQLDS